MPSHRIKKIRLDDKKQKTFLLHSIPSCPDTILELWIPARVGLPQRKKCTAAEIIILYCNIVLRQTLRHIGKRWRILANVETYWQTLRHIGKRWGILASVKEYLPWYIDMILRCVVFFSTEIRPKLLWGHWYWVINKWLFLYILFFLLHFQYSIFLN